MMSRMPASISTDSGIVDHRLVVHRQQLLAAGERHRVQPRAAAAGEQDALHAHGPRPPCPCAARHSARADRLPPGAVVQVPLHGLAQAAVEVVRRGPVQRGGGAGRVDLVAEVVAGAVGDELDQPLPRAGRVGHQLVQRGADGAHDLQVGARLPGADGQGGAGLRLLDSEHQGLGVVVDEQPVPLVGAVAVDGQRLALQRVERDQRDQLLRELPRAVVVGGVGDEGGAAVGVVPGPDQVVGRRLAGRIGAAGIIGRGLGEGRVVRARGRRTPRRSRCGGSGTPPAPAWSSAAQ